MKRVSLKRTGHVRALSLAVAEVDDMLASLVDARRVKHLNSQQRQQLEKGYQSLSLVRRAATGQYVDIPVETLVEVLRCVSMTQRWLQSMFDDYAVVTANE